MPIKEGGFTSVLLHLFVASYKLLKTEQGLPVATQPGQQLAVMMQRRSGKWGGGTVKERTEERGIVGNRKHREGNHEVPLLTLYPFLRQEHCMKSQAYFQDFK